MTDEIEDDASLVEQTIEAMEMMQQCAHPLHYHSFSQVGLLLSGPMRVCVACEGRLRNVIGYGGDMNRQVLRCVACNAYSHRSCAMVSKESARRSIWDNKHCKVNAKNFNLDKSNSTIDPDEPSTRTEETENQEFNSEEGVQRQQSLLKIFSSKNQDEPHSESQSCNEDDCTVGKDNNEDVSMVWTEEGPPRHWASEGNFQIPTPPSKEVEKDESDEVEVTTHSFISVAKALQENITTHFRGLRQEKEHLQQSDANTDTSSADSNTGMVLLSRSQQEATSIPRCQEEVSMNTKNLLKEVKVQLPPTTSEKVARIAKSTIDVACTSSKVRRNIGIASVAGGIFGGVAGLFMAGPAGAVVGAKCGQTAGMIGVLLEGSITVGVIVAGAAAGSFTAKQIQENHEKRIIAIGEEGAKQKLLLVRPHVVIDPAWENICANAKRSAPENDPGLLPFPLVGKPPAKQAEDAQKERYRRDSDIVNTDESELTTSDKVLLLVSRILNDKLSLPGHVYRSLLDEHHKRARQQKLDDISRTLDNLERDSLREIQGETIKDDKQLTIRSRREDAHAVIKHVTATLLEVRPGFASSPGITEMSAIAVEGLVFAKLYDSVFEEIREETREVDAQLMSKIQDFDAAHKGFNWDEVSPDALSALSLMQEARTASDKLSFAVNFLELLSEHFSDPHNSASADSLLKMACQHLVVAKVPYMNAEMAFLEEFARDEQLLKGKEGYALVTLQASMHFLNASNNFDKDIFFPGDD